MSGYMWEADKQPNICEAATTFTFSTVNLMIAIPMFLVDLVVSACVSLISLVWLILGPCLEYTKLGCAMLAEALGIDEQPSNLTLVTYLLAGAMVFSVYSENKKHSQGSVNALLSRVMNFVNGILFFLSVVYMPDFEDTVVLPRLITMALVCTAAADVIRAMFREFYRHLAQEESQLRKFSNGMVDFLNYEGVMFIILAAFGYPSFTEADDITKYYFIIPIAALVMTAKKFERAELPTAAPAVTTNGSAVAIKEVETEVEKVEEAAATPEAAVDAEKESAEEEQEVAVTAAATDATDEGQTVEPVAAADEKKEDAVEPVAAAAAEPCKYLARVSSLLATVQGKLCAVLSPVMACAACPISYAYNLPWAVISFFLATNLSAVLEGVAWFHLTGNNLALALPVLSALLPPLLARYGDCLTKMCSYTSAVLEWLPQTGRALTLYLMVTNTVEL